jgi:hypothetical protein
MTFFANVRTTVHVWMHCWKLDQAQSIETSIGSIQVDDFMNSLVHSLIFSIA